MEPEELQDKLKAQLAGRKGCYISTPLKQELYFQGRRILNVGRCVNMLGETSSYFIDFDDGQKPSFTRVEYAPVLEIKDVV